ncbi:hypothetical protein ABK040_012993 [Willaertia magna]
MSSYPSVPIQFYSEKQLLDLLVIKIVNNSVDSSYEVAINEIMKKGPHLVEVKGYINLKGGICILMKHYKFGDFNRLIDDKNIIIPEHVLKNMLLKLCLALDHLHFISIVHNDIHEGNILIDDIKYNYFNGEITDIDVVLSDIALAERSTDIQEGSRGDIENLGLVFQRLIGQPYRMVDGNLTAAQIRNIAIVNNWVLRDEIENNQNTITPNEIPYFKHDRIYAQLPIEHCNIINLWRMYCIVQILDESQTFENKYLYPIVSVHIDFSCGYRYLGLKVLKLIYSKTKKEVDFIEENVSCRVEITHNTSYTKLLCCGEFTFTPTQENDFVVPISNINLIPSNTNTDNINYYEYQYLLNNSEMNFDRLIKYNKCPLGFPILSHFVARGLKEKCKILLQSGKDPNEKDCLGKTAYDWADYYKANGLDSDWLRKWYLRYQYLNGSLTFNKPEINIKTVNAILNLQTTSTNSKIMIDSNDSMIKVDLNEGEIINNTRNLNSKSGGKSYLRFGDIFESSSTQSSSNGDTNIKVDGALNGVVNLKSNRNISLEVGNNVNGTIESYEREFIPTQMHLGDVFINSKSFQNDGALVTANNVIVKSENFAFSGTIKSKLFSVDTNELEFSSKSAISSDNVNLKANN